MTFEQEFNARLNAFLTRTTVSPTALGLKALGDPSLIRQVRRGRSPSLRTADRLLAYIAAYEMDADGARAPPARFRGPTSAKHARRTRKGGAMTRTPKEEKTRWPRRFLRISEVQALTGLARSTIYAWSAQGRFPAAIRLSPRAVRWSESDVQEWLRERVAEGWGEAKAIAH
jgi:prophage regulatory protein